MSIIVDAGKRKFVGEKKFISIDPVRHMITFDYLIGHFKNFY